MGNWDCKKSDQALTVTNFEQDKWAMVNTSLHPLCFMLKNYYHPNLRLLKWISSSTKEDSLSKWRNQNKIDFLPTIYESGQTSSLSEPATAHSYQPDKRSYIIVEELICLKDIKISETQGAVIAYKCLQAYQVLIRQFGGFVALENMIFINREGYVKVWVNQNLADSWIQYPHPAINQEQFVGSLLNHIFTKVEGETNGIHEYIKLGPVTFSEVMSKLRGSIEQIQIRLAVVQKQRFDRTMDTYEGKLKLSKKEGKKLKTLIQESTNSSNSLNKLKFMVADSPKNEKESQQQVHKQYIKDYSQKTRSEFPNASMYPMQQQQHSSYMLERKLNPVQMQSIPYFQINQTQGCPAHGNLVSQHIQYNVQPALVGNQIWGL